MSLASLSKTVVSAEMTMDPTISAETLPETSSPKSSVPSREARLPTPSEVIGAIVAYRDATFKYGNWTHFNDYLVSIHSAFELTPAALCNGQKVHTPESFLEVTKSLAFIEKELDAQNRVGESLYAIFVGKVKETWAREHKFAEVFSYLPCDCALPPYWTAERVRDTYANPAVPLPAHKWQVKSLAM